MHNDYTIRELTAEEFKPLFDKNKNDLFGDDHSYAPWKLLDEIELQSVDELGVYLKDTYHLRLGIFDQNNTLVGWSWGWQENKTTFYMPTLQSLKSTEE